jgi:hypothetical protein
MFRKGTKSLMILPEPVGTGRDCVGLSASLERVDLCWVQPGQWQPCRAEERDVGEQTDSGTLCRSGIGGIDALGQQAGKNDHHGQALTNGAGKEQFAAANVLNQPPG